MKPVVRRRDLVEPELSYKIVGCAFEVFNTIGPGHLEKVYQKAMAEALRKNNVKFMEQARTQVEFNGVDVGVGFCDLFVENKIIVELKRGSFIRRNEFEQLQNYLVQKQILLGIQIRFTSDGVMHKRILNLQMHS